MMKYVPQTIATYTGQNSGCADLASPCKMGKNWNFRVSQSGTLQANFEFRFSESDRKTDTQLQVDIPVSTDRIW